VLKQPTITDIRVAAQRIGGYVHRTPVITCASIDRLCDGTFFFKCENFQKSGSFKIRGAANAVFSLNEEALMRGVATHSSGNHGAALALAAGWKDARAFVVMPESAPSVKKNSIREYGAEIVYCRPSLESREKELLRLTDRTGATFVHPYNNREIISGQGTAALELFSDVPDLDVVLAPVGGGGLLSGTAIAASAVSPGTTVIAAEPSMADDAFRSFHAGKIIPSTYPDTVADGLRTSLGELTFHIITDYVGDIVTVSEEAIIHAMRLVWERMKVLVEPSAAVTVGALLERKDVFSKKRTGIILSGGNADLDNIPWITRRT
jgi:threonine dehydratase